MERARGRKIDQLDHAVISILCRDPQISNKAIAQQVGAAESTISNRIESLVNDRLIKLTVQQEVSATEFRRFGWIEIWCDIADVETIAETISANDSVFSVTSFHQNPYLLVVAMARSLEELQDIHEKVVGAVPGVRKTAMNASVGDMYIKSRLAVL